MRLVAEGWGSLYRYFALLLVIALALISLFPLYWAVITSFKGPDELVVYPPSFVITRPSLYNLQRLLQGTGISNAPVQRWFLNSVVVTLVTTTGSLLLVSLAGYAFARLEFPGRRIMFAMVIATMLVPGWSTLIASYALTRQLNLHDTYWGLILPSLASAFGLFLFRQFALTLPEELFQAARIDGASEIGLWWSIAMPLCRPVIATLAIFTMTEVWNDFLWPLLILNKMNLFTLPVGAALLMYQFQEQGPDYGIAMAVALLMSALPLVAFLLMQRQMIKGLTLGGLKG
jgi:ABC-type glycerol-3-phosphate transport system permease component